MVIYWAEFMTPFKEQPHHRCTPAALEDEVPEVHSVADILGWRDPTSLVDTREDAAAPEEEVGCGLVWPTPAGAAVVPHYRSFVGARSDERLEFRLRTFSILCEQ